MDRRRFVAGVEERGGSQGHRWGRVGGVLPSARRGAGPRSLRGGAVGAESVRRLGHQGGDGRGDGAGRDPVRPAHRGVADEQRGGPRSGTRTRPAGRRRGQGDHGDRRDPWRLFIMTSPSRRTLRRVAGVVVAVAAALSLAACSSGSSGSGTTTAAATSSAPASASASPSEASGSAVSSSSAGAPAAPGATGPLTVFAAASLKATFTELGQTFQQQNPGTTVTFNFAGSSDLVTQLTGGAPADVFASADENNMNKAVTGGVIDGTPVNFASNILTIVTQPGNPKGIAGFAALANPD